MKRWIAFICILILLSDASLAAPGFPGSAEPGRVQKNYLPAPVAQPVPQKQQVTTQEKTPTPVSPEAQKIKFKLTHIILQGNHIYSETQLLPLYKDKLNNIISIAELEVITQNITNFYRNNGYILSRAILPPQHVDNGTIRIRIIEGYIDQVKVIGNPRYSAGQVRAYGEKIAASRPITMQVINQYLRLANEIPGVEVKAILEPSKTQVGASDLNLAVEEKILNASISYDNYGTLYIGPLQITASVSANSIFRSGDSVHLTYLATTHGAQLHYVDLNYQTYLNSNGLQFTGGGNQSFTNPGLNLKPLDTQGQAETYYALLQYPWIRTRSDDLTLEGGFTYLNSATTLLNKDVLLYNDHVRPIKLGGVYNFADKFNGTDSAIMHIEQGLKILGASSDPHSLYTSRFGADGIYTKISGQISHIQPLVSRLSLFTLAEGQFSFNPLLSPEQFGFGGSQVGRGYDPAEILGDRGAAGSVELRADTYPQWFNMQNIQLYVFYDIGAIWDIKHLPNSKQKESASSTGVGARFAFAKYLSGNLMFTQVLTKSIASESVIGRGRDPKVYFSMVAAG